MKRFALSAVERYVYTPYGEVLVNQETSFGDRDGDNDVDATDKGTVGVTCTGTVSGSCRILDLDFDGDYDSTDATAFDALTQGLARHPGRTSTAVNQPFAHQGLLFEPEIGSYQNRKRQYNASARRFNQKDPLFGPNPRTERHYRDGLNLFRYLNNNTLNRIDPYGLYERKPDTRDGSKAKGGGGGGFRSPYWGQCGVVSCDCPIVGTESRVTAQPHLTRFKTFTFSTLNSIYLLLPYCCDLEKSTCQIPDSGEGATIYNCGPTIKHECAHICAATHYGAVIYDALYVAEWIRCGGNWDCNYFEQEAELIEALSDPWTWRMTRYGPCNDNSSNGGGQ